MSFSPVLEWQREWPASERRLLGAPRDWPEGPAQDAPGRRLRLRGVPHLRVVAAEILYASGQPVRDAYGLLRHRGLRSVVNLRAEAWEWGERREERQAQGLHW